MTAKKTTAKKSASKKTSTPKPKNVELLIETLMDSFEEFCVRQEIITDMHDSRIEELEAEIERLQEKCDDLEVRIDDIGFENDFAQNYEVQDLSDRVDALECEVEEHEATDDNEELHSIIAELTARVEDLEGEV